MTDYTTLRELQNNTLAVFGKAEVSVFKLVEPNTVRLENATDAKVNVGNRKYDAVKFAGKWFLTGDYEYTE